MDVSKEIVDSVIAAIQKPLEAARLEGYHDGVKYGRLFAVQEMEAEVARFVIDGTLEANSEIATALAKAAGWLRQQ